MEDSLMWPEVEKILTEKGIEVRQHPLTDDDESYVVMVKDGQVKSFIDRPLPPHQ